MVDSLAYQPGEQSLLVLKMSLTINAAISKPTS